MLIPHKLLENLWFIEWWVSFVYLGDRKQMWIIIFMAYDHGVVYGIKYLLDEVTI